VVGGCSAHNGCTASVGARADYDEWEGLGNPGWGAASMEPLLDLARSRFRVSAIATDDLTPVQAAFVEAGRSRGLPFADDLDRLEAGPGIGPMTANVVDGLRWNASFGFLDPSRSRDSLRVLGGALIERLEIEDGRAVSAVATIAGERRSIRAERFVVCAGAYGSPAILLRSGVGSPSELAELGIDLRHELKGVGENLIEHPCLQVNFAGGEEFHRAVRELPSHPDEQAIARARSSLCDEGPYDVHIFLVAGANTGHPDLPPISLYASAVKARSAGKVSLASAEPAVGPIVDYRFLSDPEGHDRSVLAEARQMVREIVAEPGFAAQLGPCLTDDERPIEQLLSGYCHPAGTCALGPDPADGAVVDHEGRVHGLANVFVADASVMPTITRGNINLPTAAIAARVAAGLLGFEPAELADAAPRLSPPPETDDLPV
jgi:choline dehydrogenase